MDNLRTDPEYRAKKERLKKERKEAIERVPNLAKKRRLEEKAAKGSPTLYFIIRIALTGVVFYFCYLFLLMINA